MTTFIVCFQVHYKSVWRARRLPLLRSIHLHLQGEGSRVRSTRVTHCQVCQQIPGFTQVNPGFTQVQALVQALLRYPRLYSGTTGFTVLRVHDLRRYSHCSDTGLLRYRLYSGTGFAQIKALLMYRLCPDTGFAQVQALLRYSLCSGTGFT
jgi:hypothetical protein